MTLGTMRATGVMRFVVFGAVGFGVGGIIVGVIWPLAFLFSFQAAGLLFVLSVGGWGSFIRAGPRRPGKNHTLGRAGDPGFCSRGSGGVSGGCGYRAGVRVSVSF